jgi:nucleotide-binding universal stress UspA family protein
MKSVLVPIDDSKDMQWAINHVVSMYRQEPVKIHLLNVQTLLPQDISRFFSRGEVRDFHRDNGMLALKPANEILDQAGVPYRNHVAVGRRAEMIVRFAQEHDCSQIIIAKRAEGLLSNMGLGTIGSQLRHLMGAGNTCDVCEVS